MTTSDSLSLDAIIQSLNLSVITNPKDFTSIYPTAGYTSDLLSCVMASDIHQGLWITLQAHTNIVAVAALLEMSAIIITENAAPDANTIHKANEEGVVLLGTAMGSFEVVGKLWELGLRAK